MRQSIIILSFNSEATIGNTIAAARKVSDDIHVVDSFSTDSTPDIVRQHNAHFITHEFRNYSHQRNWSIDNLPLKYEWELHLDADEVLSEELISELNDLSAAGEVAGYFIPRLVQFMGRYMRHGGMFPIWHMRLFQRGLGRCEDREYDQHFIVSGATAKLRGALIDEIRMPLTEWTTRHNRWSDAEVRELRTLKGTTNHAKLVGNPVERKRYLRNVYSHQPLFFRAFLLFVYRYIIRLGFLDGKEGLVFYCLQTFWFRFLIDSKLYEQQLADNERPRLSAQRVLPTEASRAAAAKGN
jgi:glycosyltransferase involved in cell wall biosynthesis